MRLVPRSRQRRLCRRRPVSSLVSWRLLGTGKEMPTLIRIGKSKCASNPTGLRGKAAQACMWCAATLPAGRYDGTSTAFRRRRTPLRERARLWRSVHWARAGLAVKVFDSNESSSTYRPTSFRAAATVGPVGYDNLTCAGYPGGCNTPGPDDAYCVWPWLAFGPTVLRFWSCCWSGSDIDSHGQNRAHVRACSSTEYCPDRPARMVGRWRNSPARAIPTACSDCSPRPAGTSTG